MSDSDEKMPFSAEIARQRLEEAQGRGIGGAPLDKEATETAQRLVAGQKVYMMKKDSDEFSKKIGLDKMADPDPEDYDEHGNA